jgi:hypothetical protein
VCSRNELVAKLGKRFIDILVADALYLQTPFVRPDLAAEAERLTNRPADYRDANARQELGLWHLPEVDWPLADRLIRVVKTVRVLAYTLAMVFYFRQVRSHAHTTPPSFCQMARQFGYAFVTLRFDSC